MLKTIGVGDYLIKQILAGGARHVFGVPGDYALGFFKKLSQSRLQVINTCDEQGAGFAADAYARLNGLGVVAVTYGVGGLKVVNTTAEAFAEKVPVLVISGAPGASEKQINTMLHHKSNRYDTQLKIFEQITTASAELNNPATALQEIERVLAAIRRDKKPGFLELPRDMVSTEVEEIPKPVFQEAQSDPGALSEALQEAAAKINAAQRPIIWVGEELSRYGLSSLAIQLAEKTNIPMVVSILGKSTVPETHPLYVGVYAGGLGDDLIRRYVEESDCLIMLGVLLTDINLGVYSVHLDQSKTLMVNSDRISIDHHYYDRVAAADFLSGLLQSNISACSFNWSRSQPALAAPDPANGSNKMNVKSLFQHINAFLDCNMVVICDVGDALFGAIDLETCRAAQFLSPAYYASLGFAVPASIGVQVSNKDLRPLVLVGDGAFQMTGMELSTVVRYHLNPIVIVLNNAGYGTERPMLDGTFNDVLNWNYSRLPDVLGQGAGFTVTTEAQLDSALSASLQNKDSFSIIDVKLAAQDISPALQRLTTGLGSVVK